MISRTRKNGENQKIFIEKQREVTHEELKIEEIHQWL